MKLSVGLIIERFRCLVLGVDVHLLYTGSSMRSGEKSHYLILNIRRLTTRYLIKIAREVQYVTYNDFDWLGAEYRAAVFRL